MCFAIQITHFYDELPFFQWLSMTSVLMSSRSDSVRVNPDTVNGETSEMDLFVRIAAFGTLFQAYASGTAIFFISRLIALPVSRLTSVVSNLDSFQPLEQPVTLITDQSLPVAIALALNSSGVCFDM
jgi:hypothetical protein